MLLRLGLLMCGKRPRPVHRNKPTLWGQKRALFMLIQGQCILRVFWFFLAWNDFRCGLLQANLTTDQYVFQRTLTRASFTKTGCMQNHQIISNHIFICFYHILCNDYIMKYKLKSSNMIFYKWGPVLPHHLHHYCTHSTVYTGVYVSLPSLSSSSSPPSLPPSSFLCAFLRQLGCAKSHKAPKDIWGC